MLFDLRKSEEGEDGYPDEEDGLDDALLADLRSATRVLRAHGLWRPGTREGAEPLRCRCTWQEPDAGANNSLDPRTGRA